MQRLDFNTGWHFSCPDGRDFDVTLPHDAMLNTTRNTEPGFTWFLLAGWRGNDYTYTKNLHITSELINKHLVLEFEGVYCMTTVTVNDRPAAEKAYGYTPFTVELDGLLHEGDNTIEVTAHVPQDGHNRWYTGGGIYRPVHLLVGEDAYMQRYGVRVTTLSVAPACVRVEVMTHGGDCAEVRIAEKNGKEVVCAQAAVADGHAVVELEIPDAKLWNAEHPNLYLAEVTLYSGGKAVDTVTESFGLRVIEIDPARGLLINGEPTFLRGGCIHNDMGVIGVINNDATELHRARNIKKAGFNAIRSAHHPMSRSLMKACDEVGLYVMDEAFDYWYRMKSPNSPYNRYFMQDFKVDTAAMVQDAYNHPSVVIYSIGNEIPEAGGVKGVRVGKEIVDAIAFGYPQRIFGVNPKPPRLRKCYDFLNYSHFPLTGWEAVCYSELAEILCTAPLQLNTQHNRYFTLPVGRTAWSRQTITHDWGEGIMILLLPHASDGVTELGL